MTGVMRRFSAALAAAAMAVSIVPFADISAYAEYAATHPEGFVYADGSKFMCDGSPYYYGGTNCYYLTYKSKSEVKNVFDDASKMGLKVIRIWGNLDVGKKTGKIDSQSGHEIFEGNNDGTGEKDGVYFQYWDDEAGKPVVNEGEDGLRHLDYIIKQAEEHDMKLVITFTNYWEAFGGMGQYVKWYQMSQGKSVGNSKVDEKDTCDFYTNETIKGWYKDYIKTLLNHTNYYTGEKLMDSEAVFSWELSNEPRCTVDEFCKDDILYNWAKEMSAYVKSIDPYHMVSVGDEGFYNLGYQEAAKQDLPSSAYSGYYGVDFDKLMTIDTVDFGTPHMYVDQWGFDLGDDDLEWIKRHAQTTSSADKPIIFEEFGLTDKTKRDAAYSDWLDIVTGDYYEGVEYQGFNYWMIASYLDDGTLYQDYDGYTVYGPEGIEKTDSTRTLMMNAAAKMEKKNIVNTTDKSTYSFDRSKSGNVVVNVSMKEGSISGVEVGEKVYTCSCGEKYTETIPATGHSESAWIIDKAANATENGSKHTECTTCGKVIKTEVIPATGEVSDKKETVIFTGSAKTSGWGQAITLSTTKEGGSFDSSVIEKDGYFEVQFKGGTDKAEVILQSWSGGADWARVSPTEVTEKDGIVYAKYSYDDVAAAFGTTDFSKVDRFHVGAANGDIEVLSVKYIVGKSTEPVDPVDPVDPDKPEQDPYVSIFWGAKSCGSWGQAVSVMTSKNYGSFDVSYLSANGYFYVEYSGAENELELILQSWSGGASWARVQPSETGRANDRYYAKFTYADCVKELGAGFDKLDQLHAAAKNGDITVYSICYCTPAK